MSNKEKALVYARDISTAIRNLEHRMHMTDMFMFEVKDELMLIMESVEEFEHFDSLEPGEMEGNYFEGT